MIPGGIADKLGNRYEAKWLVRNFIDVVANKAQWLKFEGVETEYQGFEFAIGRGETTEWHQTKVSAPKGNWTINALKNEGVLKSFSNRFAADVNAHCFFVSQDNAKDFRTLTDKARIASTSDQYGEILSDDQKRHFDQLKEEWQQDDEILLDWLKRSNVEIIPERELDSLNESFGGLYFYDGGENTFSDLRELLENHFNITLTCDTARQAIKAHGTLKFKEWSFDPTIHARLNEENEAYLQTYTPFGAGGETIARLQSETLIDEILKADGPELVLLTGIAGSGKSGVVRSAMAQLRALDVPLLAFRVDHYLSCSTREELGRKLTGREEGPVTTLKGTYPDKTAIIFIDQIDAVSEVSGRDGQVKEVIFRLISDASFFGGVRIVVACRTFDLESDPRLKRLKEANRTKHIDIPLFDWKEDVEPILINRGVEISLFTEPQRQLLLLPVNLAVFLEIDDPGFLFNSRASLHEKLIEKKQRIISRERKPSWSLIQPLSAMCAWMSQRQKLDAPAGVLDSYANAVDILTSEGLIVSSRGKINFFHESFFDHIYARTFVNEEQTLIDFLTTTEQHLFRRTQVRQILEALRQNDYDRYIIELSKVLSSQDIRFHIKTAICKWMSSLEQSHEDEFEIISRFNETSGSFHQFFRSAVLSTHTWFDLLNEKGWIKSQIDGDIEECSNLVFWWLSNIAGERPTAIANLLRAWWAGDKARAERLLDWFGYIRRGKPDDELVLLCEDVIKTHPKNLFGSQGRDRTMMLLRTWADKTPDRCGQILHSLFDAWFALNPGHNPFERDELKALDIYSLADLGKKAPLALLQGTTDAIVRAIDMVVAEGEKGKSYYNFNSRAFSGHRFGFDEFLGIYRAALNKLLQETPEEAVSFLDKIEPYKHQCFMHLHLEAIQTNPAMLSKRLPALAESEMVFDAGWRGADWLSFSNACNKVFPLLDIADKKFVELAILSHTPELDLAIRIIKKINEEGETDPFWTKKSVIYDLNKSGYEQWCILKTIGEKLLSPVAIKRLHEHHRKFPKVKIAEPEHMEAHCVGSPIKRPQCERMKDSDWLSAIARYNNEEDRRRGRNFIDGGARELSRELQTATKEDPVRFAKLCLEIPDTAHYSYIESILWGLAEIDSVSDNALISVLKRAHKHPEKPFGRDLTRLVGNHSHVAADPEILNMLIWYALNGDANDDEESDKHNTERETIDINSLMDRGDRLHIRGINGARGNAWEALGAVLWELPEVERQAGEAIEIAIGKEVLVSVRCCMMKPLTPLFNTDKEKFTNAIRQLIVLPEGAPRRHDISRLSPLITHAGIDLFPYVFYHLPEVAGELVTELLECGDKNIELIGAWLIFCHSFRDDAYVEQADKLASVSIDHRRLLADVTSDVLSWTEYRHRAETLLKEFFFDTDEQVRKKAADAFRGVKAVEVESYRDLAAIFIKSPAFTDDGFAVLHMLESATCDVLDLVVDASQQVIADIVKKGDEFGHHGTDVHQLQDLLKSEYASSEFNPEARKKILDIIDLMMMHEIYGVDSIVTAHERW